MKSRNLFLLVSLLCAANAFAIQRTFVSAGSGSDLNPCTAASPCRSFAAALLITDANGEVIAVDSGGYGVVTITQAVSIIAPSGVYAGVTATTGSAITVNAANTAQVVIRNLFLNSLGADYGVDGSSVGVLSVEGCTITGFNSVGVIFYCNTGLQRVAVTDSTIRRCGYAGVDVEAGVGILDSLLLYDNLRNVMIFTAQAVVRNCVAKGGGFYGFYSGLAAKAVIEDSVASGNNIGFYANSGTMAVTRCNASNNSTGLEADITGTSMYVSDSTITENVNGIVTSSNGAVNTRGNNLLTGNATDGTFTATYSAQ